MRVGQTLAGRYLLEEHLGSGGIGEVYRARNTVLGRTVAIKLLKPELAKDRDLVRRLLQEARAANIVRHPNVVDVLDIGEDKDGVPFVVRECLEGYDLARHLRDIAGKLPVKAVIELMLPVADAVAAAHAKGIVHRDIKPQNVFLSKTGGRTVPKLLDLGLSHTEAAAGGKAPRTDGTPAYMSPEQFADDTANDPRIDVWALGVIMFELISGKRPFAAPNVLELGFQISTVDAPRVEKLTAGVPEEMGDIVARCLSRDPAARYANAGGLVDALRAARESDAVKNASRSRVPKQSSSRMPAVERVGDAEAPPPASRARPPLPLPPGAKPPPPPPSSGALAGSEAPHGASSSVLIAAALPLVTADHVSAPELAFEDLPPASRREPAPPAPPSAPRALELDASVLPSMPATARLPVSVSNAPKPPPRVSAPRAPAKHGSASLSPAERASAPPIALAVAPAELRAAKGGSEAAVTPAVARPPTTEDERRMLASVVTGLVAFIACGGLIVGNEEWFHAHPPPAVLDAAAVAAGVSIVAIALAVVLLRAARRAWIDASPARCVVAAAVAGVALAAVLQIARDLGRVTDAPSPPASPASSAQSP